LSLTNNFGTPLHYLVLSATDENWSEHQKFIKMALDEGADINACDATGETPLLRLCVRKNLPCVQFLIQNGASVNIQNW
jgi:ankyrin repeat protein